MKHLAPLIGAAVCIFALGTISMSAQTLKTVAGSGAVSAQQGDVLLVGTIGQAVIGHTHAVSSQAAIGFWNTQAAKATSGLTGNNTDAGLDMVSSPNPFSKATSLSFNVPVSGHVSLVIYNNLGEPLRTIIDGRADEGRISRTVDLTGLPSGKYTALLRVGDRQASTTLLLVD